MGCCTSATSRGSERSADSMHHSKARMAETQAINLSLLALKDCIRARTIRSAHIPYRRSKLTLLLKDAFDPHCARLCSTVILAHVCPLIRDLSHSIDTIKYAAPLRVSMLNIASDPSLPRDERNPAGWTCAQIVQWLDDISCRAFVDYSELLPAGTCGGMDFCRVPETEMYRRVMHSSFHQSVGWR